MTTTAAAGVEDGAPTTGRPRRGRIQWRLATVVILVLVAAVVAFLISRRPAATGSGGLPPHTATVQRTTLVETQTVPGTLGYGPVIPLAAGLSGTVTRLPAPGATVERGAALFTLDLRPVVLMIGSVPAFRPMRTGDTGPDVAQLERNLAGLGYRGLTVDTRYTAGTASAVRRWQRDLGLSPTGAVELGRVVFLPGAVRVDSLGVRAGERVGPDQTVLNHTGRTKVVSVDLAVTLVGLARRGGEVTVTVPGRPPVSGTVASVGTTIRAGESAAAGSGGPGGSGQPGPATVLVTIAVADQAALGEISGAPVQVELVAQRREDVLAVPVAALLARPEGGYGVQVVDGSGTRLVPVRTGLFARGLVEVAGAGIDVGTTVATAAP